MLPHPAGNVGHNDVSTFDLDAKARIGEGLCHHTLDLKSFFLLFCHKNSPGNHSSTSRPRDWPNPIILALAAYAGPVGFHRAASGGVEILLVPHKHRSRLDGDKRPIGTPVVAIKPI